MESRMIKRHYGDGHHDYKHHNDKDYIYIDDDKDDDHALSHCVLDVTVCIPFMSPYQARPKTMLCR